MPVGEPAIGYPAYPNEYGGRLPIGSMKNRRTEKRKKSLLYITKFLFFGGALGLIVVAILRFTAVQEALV